MSYALINGALTPEVQACLPLGDAGLLLGAGVFTTMLAQGKSVAHLSRHLLRLRRSCETLRIPWRADDVQLTGWMDELLEANGLAQAQSRARVRLTLTRGSGGAPNLFATASAFQPYSPDFYNTGAAVLMVEPFRLNPHSLTAGHKTLDYVGRLAALDDAKSQGAAESLWQDVEGRLQSGCISNVFCVQAGELLTPPTNADLANTAAKERCGCSHSAVLPGITREVVLELARKIDLPVRITSLPTEAARRSAECFLTNSLMGILPVQSVDGAPIGAGAPGPLTRRLMQAYAAHLLDMAAR